MRTWLNIFKLPEPFAHLISEDLYNEEREAQLVAYCNKAGLNRAQILHFSASDLIKPPRARVLIKRHEDEIVTDVSTQVYRILGQAIHGALRESCRRMSLKGIANAVLKPFGLYIAEERLFTHFKSKTGQIVVISGEPDLITPDNWIHDYKVTAVFSLGKGIKVEWEQATNTYAWLRSLKGEVTAGILITFILRDWMRSQAVQEGYPPAAAQTMDVRLWTFDEQQRFIEDRVFLQMEADLMPDEDLPECTSDEMWEKPESWAVIREKGARAAKLYKGEDFPDGTERDVILKAATADAEIRTEKLKKKDGTFKKGEVPYIVTHRPGERTKCQSYCDAAQFCNVWHEYTAAAYQGSGRTKVDEVA